jgi:hypothetical protein
MGVQTTLRGPWWSSYTVGMANDNSRQPIDPSLDYSVFKGLVFIRARALSVRYKLPALRNVGPKSRLCQDLHYNDLLKDLLLEQLQKDFAIKEIPEDHKLRIVTYEDLVDYCFVNFNFEAPALAHFQLNSRGPTGRWANAK